MPEQLSVLSHPHALATKKWHLGPSGKPLVEEYGRGKRFQCHVVPVEDFDGLAEWLESLLEEPYAFIIRGEPFPSRDLTDILRTKLPRDNEPPGFREVPRRWLMIDADQVLTREDVTDLDFSRPEDCEKGVKRILAQLPIELQKASCFWQLSSSAGFKPGLRAHLWFWLDRPMGERELTRWAENVNDVAGRRLIDPSVFRTVQPNYTANPIFEVGVSDPVGKRSGVIKGIDELILPRLAERTNSYLRKLEPLRDPKNENVRDPIMRACASYFCARSPDAPADDLFAALRRGVDQSCALRGVTDSKYDDATLREYIEGGRKFSKNRAGLAENLARNNDGSLKPALENARALIASTPEWDGVLGFNLRRGKAVVLVEPPFEDGYRGPSGVLPRDWTDTDDRRAVSWLQRLHALTVHPGIAADAVDVVARENTFDPVQDFLRGLTWDKESRIDSWLIDYLGIEPSNYSRRVGAMWLIQGVARALNPGCKADCILILEGDQGLRRKSTTLATLAAHPEFFREGLKDIDSKDTLLAMQSAWIVELREMASITNREVEAVKAFLDRQNDHYRAPYGRRSEDHPRRCIFAGTTNASNYLRDVTGARRFWPVTCGTIDSEGLENVRDQLWAEAVHRYHAGEPWWVEADDPDFVREQDARYDIDARQEALEKALKDGCARHRYPSDPEHPIPPIEANAQKVTVAQILYHHWGLKVVEQDRRQQMAVTEMLKKLGWNSIRIGAIRYWRKK